MTLRYTSLRRSMFRSLDRGLGSPILLQTTHDTATPDPSIAVSAGAPTPQWTVIESDGEVYNYTGNTFEHTRQTAGDITLRLGPASLGPYVTSVDYSGQGLSPTVTETDLNAMSNLDAFFPSVLAQEIKAGERDGVYIDFVNDEAWVKDSATPANDFDGAASTLLDKAYTTTADGARINSTKGGFVLARADHNWSATTGTHIVGHKSDDITQDNTRIISHNIRYPLSYMKSAVDNAKGGYRTSDDSTFPFIQQFATTTNRQIMAMSYGGNGRRFSLSGGSVVAEAFHGSYPDQDIGIGMRPHDSAAPMDGWVDTYLYTPEQVSDETLIRESAITTQLTYEVILIAGQSNAVGRALYSSGGSGDGEYHQFATERTQAEVLIDARTGGTPELDHPDDGRNDENDSYGLAMTFSQDYLFDVTDGDKKILFVAAAKGGTGFANGDWNKGDASYEAAVARVNEVIANVPNATLTAILWHQGERDAFDEASATYEASLDQMISDLRSDLTGGTSVPFVLGGLSPDYVANPDDGAPAAQASAIQASIEDTPNRVSNCAYAASTSLSGNPHFDSDSIQTLGQRYKTALDTL